MQHIIPITILRRGQVSERTSLSGTTIDELVRRDLFPQPVPLTKRTKGWVEAEVDDWLRHRRELRDMNDPRLLAVDRILNADLSRPTAA